MERYFPVVKRSAAGLSSQLKSGGDSVDERDSFERSNDGVSRAKTTTGFNPYAKSSLNKMLLKTLGDDANPITHSDLADRSDKVISTSTGRQVAEDVTSRKRYFKERQEALRVQHQPSKASAPATGIFRNTRIYINGYLEGTTDIEVKRIVIEGGGKVLFTPSRSTHILTSTGLNGSKTEKYLKTVKASKPFIVKPEWILDSVASGRRRSEKSYIVKMDQTLQGFMRGD
ncbi:hypothetical protein D9611_002396 [Ephemerocybe angulata]|uniref:BRCT domain-containing protein n=1 Tax=Ephemerocybe angulata TaxID=980116 RepID=A0A8H5C1D8_9AGAR|nr:hypothetical protein D9611_002396 [Tulosesus angulatus]